MSRRQPSLIPAKRILIVTEGTFTEPTYFNHVKSERCISSLDVDICGECGSDPLSVVEHAKNKSNVEGSVNDGGYDVVYCVFDRDTHAHLEKALSEIQSLNKKGSSLRAGKISAISSYPCFEYWFLLHFKYSRSPFTGTGAKSASDQLIDSLKKNQPFHGYNKTPSPNELDFLMQNIEKAISNSKSAMIDALETGELNPSSEIHILLEELIRTKIKEM